MFERLKLEGIGRHDISKRVAENVIQDEGFHTWNDFGTFGESYVILIIRFHQI